MHLSRLFLCIAFPSSLHPFGRWLHGAKNHRRARPIRLGESRKGLNPWAGARACRILGAVWASGQRPSCGVGSRPAARAELHCVCAAPSPRGWELRRVRVGKQDACKQDSPACGRASSHGTWRWRRRSSSFASWLASRAEAGVRSAHGSPAEAAVRSARDGATRAPTPALR